MRQPVLNDFQRLDRIELPKQVVARGVIRHDHIPDDVPGTLA
jgi:hypothetical protein